MNKNTENFFEWAINPDEDEKQQNGNGTGVS